MAGGWMLLSSDLVVSVFSFLAVSDHIALATANSCTRLLSEHPMSSPAHLALSPRQVSRWHLKNSATQRRTPPPTVLRWRPVTVSVDRTYSSTFVELSLDLLPFAASLRTLDLQTFRLTHAECEWLRGLSSLARLTGRLPFCAAWFLPASISILTVTWDIDDPRDATPHDVVCTHDDVCLHLTAALPLLHTLQTSRNVRSETLARMAAGLVGLETLHVASVSGDFTGPPLAFASLVHWRGRGLNNTNLTKLLEGASCLRSLAIESPYGYASTEDRTTTLALAPTAATKMSAITSLSLLTPLGTYGGSRNARLLLSFAACARESKTKGDAPWSLARLMSDECFAFHDWSRLDVFPLLEALEVPQIIWGLLTPLFALRSLVLDVCDAWVLLVDLFPSLTSLRIRRPYREVLRPRVPMPSNRRDLRQLMNLVHFNFGPDEETTEEGFRKLFGVYGFSTFLRLLPPSLKVLVLPKSHVHEEVLRLCVGRGIAVRT